MTGFELVGVAVIVAGFALLAYKIWPKAKTAVPEAIAEAAVEIPAVVSEAAAEVKTAVRKRRTSTKKTTRKSR